MVLNLHGINGKANNTNYRLLTEIFGEENLLSLQINYQSMSPQEIFGYIQDKIEDELFRRGDQLELVVGNSFGGFFATQIADLYSIPFILVNPCLRPDISLQTIEPSYLTDDNLDQIKIFIKSWSKELFDRCQIIFGDEDEVLDSDLAKEEAYNAKMISVSGGHRLQGQEFTEVFDSVVHKIL